ncbi:flavin-containing monooxygenase [Pseudomonas turukhanskensis]|uniref:flavin-containing monooxygenase n=1 Tax=Pseudomonas turukhanskensis TaxID=1806536 RepID=UPI0022F32521|nr:NAD(P)/FAD-dependent oxidoreductase [Pseudomonas turukhanskensis]
MNKTSPSAAPVRVLIIGAGFAGMGLAIQLQRAGITDVLLLEKASDLGGTWRDNRYPGAACDVPSHLYSFSFAPKTDWSRKFAPQAEIFAYQQQLADTYNLRPRIRFNTEVSNAVFDAEAGLWQVTCTDGTVFSAPALVTACGQLNRPLLPRVAGLETFKGEAFHSARWNAKYDLSGKRVAVIGTGASAIQFIPQIAPKVAQLHVFQRSAAYVIGKPDRAYRPWELAVMRRLPWLQKIDRGLKYVQHEARVLAFTVVPQVMKAMRLNFRWYLHRSISDPALRQRLVPDYPMGCKRILISNDYYPALARANVEVVDGEITEVTETGVRTADGRERTVDAIIYGTGFAATDFLAPMQITGLNGRDLNEAWKEGAEAYLGISVSGFPNLFILYGPNTNLGHNSILYMLESQFAYVVGGIQQLQQHQLRYMDLKPTVQAAFNHRLQKAVDHSIWQQGCDSWYKTASGKNTVNWPGFTFTYRHYTRRPELANYDCIR